MTGTQDLSELLERVEGATGADRELDALVHLVCAEGRTVWWEGNQLFSRHRSEPSDRKWLEGSIDPGVVARNWSASDYRHPQYTASLDAALALVERVLPGWRVGLNSDPDRAPLWSAQLKRRGEQWRPIGELARTPPLALLAALLKALQAQASDTQHGSQS